MKDPSIYYTGDRPYDNYGEYLEDLFAMMDIFLLQVSDETVPFLEKRMKVRGLTNTQDLLAWEKNIHDRCLFSLEIGMRLPLEEILMIVEGDAFVRNILLLSMLMVLQKGYKEVLERIFPDSEGKLTPSVCARLFFDRRHMSELDVYEAVHAHDRCLCRLFPDLEMAEEIFDMPLVCDPRLMDILAGKNRYLPTGATVFDLSLIHISEPTRH